MKTVTFVVAPAVERRVNPQISLIDPLKKQDEDFSRVWLSLRQQAEALGPGRPLICEETLAANRNYSYD